MSKSKVHAVVLWMSAGKQLVKPVFKFSSYTREVYKFSEMLTFDEKFLAWLRIKSAVVPSPSPANSTVLTDTEEDLYPLSTEPITITTYIINTRKQILDQAGIIKPMEGTPTT